jgi:hypothetical protein
LGAAAGPTLDCQDAACVIGHFGGAPGCTFAGEPLLSLGRCLHASTLSGWPNSHARKQPSDASRLHRHCAASEALLGKLPLRMSPSPVLSGLAFIGIVNETSLDSHARV